MARPSWISRRPRPERRAAAPGAPDGGVVHELARCLAEGLDRSPHVLYVRTGRGDYRPAVARGVGAPPVFAADGSLGRALRGLAGPVMTRRSHRARRLEGALDDGDRSSLRRAGAIALVPLRWDPALEGFLLVSGPLADFDPDGMARALAAASRAITARGTASRAAESGPEGRPAACPAPGRRGEARASWPD